MKRELGIFSVVAISLGAMIGSGIFVLPGLATKIAGPAAPLAYFIAGLIVVPAAFAKSEMATAMPEAGGTYVFVDKGMGPLMGTVAGFGVWFSLVFKAAFALVGLGAYLFVFAFLPVKAVAVGLTIGLVLNVIGIRQTAGVQRFVVFGVLAMFWYSSSLVHRESTPLPLPVSLRRARRGCSLQPGSSLFPMPE